jgi:hypothetical protein
MAVFGLVGAIHAVAVQESRPRLGQIAVPYVVGALEQLHPLQLVSPSGDEQAQLHLLGVSGEER